MNHTPTAAHAASSATPVITRQRIWFEPTNYEARKRTAFPIEPFTNLFLFTVAVWILATMFALGVKMLQHN